MNELVSKLEELSIIKALVIGLVIGALYWFLSEDGAQQLQVIEANKIQVETLRKDLAALENTVREVQEHQVRIGALGNELANLSSYISEKSKAIDLMKKISSEAKAAGLDILNLTESQDFVQNTGPSLYTTYNIQADLQGTFSQHLLFLSFLTNLKTIVTVGNFNMAVENAELAAAGADSPDAKFTVKLTGYRYNPEVPANPAEVTQ